jgi:ribose transport system permease protein
MTTADPIVAGRGASEGVLRQLRGSPAALAGIGVLLLILLGFSLLRPEIFPTVDNTQVILNQTAVAAIVAGAVSVSLVAGQYDLSIGAVVGLAGVVTAEVVNTGAPWPVAVLAACATGAAVGLLNGGIVTGLRVPSIVTTLGTQTVLLGVISWTTGNIYIRLESPAMSVFARGSVLGIPNTAWVMFGVCIAGALLMRYLVAGRNIHAVGRSPEASRLAGVSVAGYTVLALVATGMLAALAAVVLTAQLNSGHPEVSGGYLLPAFAAAFLGAAVSRTGTASFMGALYGALLLQCLTNGLVVLDAPSWSQQLVQGTILVLAVAVSQAARLRARRGRA